MSDEKRRAPRLNVNLPVCWEGVLEKQEATVTSLSTSGCFVLTGGKVEPRELIRLELVLHDKSLLRLWAEVVDEAYEIGFAARFIGVEDEDHLRLTAFILAALSEPNQTPPT
jgi:hypothetical protein